MPRLAPSDVLGPRAARMTMVAMAAVLGLGLAAAAIRLLPWLVSPTIPFRVAFPFAKGLAAASLEVALLVGPPLGWALAAALLVERGEARALHAVGIGPLRLVASTIPLALALAAFGALASASSGRSAHAPGRLAGDLIDEARAACVEARPAPCAVDVPLVGATWLGIGETPPRLVGSLPGPSETPFTASEIRIGDGLDTLALHDLRVRLDRGLPMRLHVERAFVRGLRPFARPSKLGESARAILFTGTGGLLALIAGWAVLRSEIAGRVQVIALGVAGPVAALGAFSAIERGTVPALAYLVVPLAAAVATLAMEQCVARRWAR